MEPPDGRPRRGCGEGRSHRPTRQGAEGSRSAGRSSRSVVFRPEIGSFPRRDRFVPWFVLGLGEGGCAEGCSFSTTGRVGACVRRARRDLGPCFDPGFSAWCRRKLFAGGGVGSSVALGVIAGKCGSLRLVLAGPAGCLRGRWRSGSWKWRHAAGSRARGRKHLAPVGALRRCKNSGTEHPYQVSKHRAPVGALRRHGVPSFLVMFHLSASTAHL